jgi:hypothetical protein
MTRAARKPRPRAAVTRLPAALQAGIRRRTGVRMDDVSVHYDSAQPDRFNALAFARGRQIHLARGQERLLPHEAWHIVQQKQGRVRPTLHEGGAAINDEPALEREADGAGDRLTVPTYASGEQAPAAAASPGGVMQRVIRIKTKAKKKGGKAEDEEYDELDEDIRASLADDHDLDEDEIGIVASYAASDEIYTFASWAEVAKAAAKSNKGLLRLRRSHARNQKRKARPVTPRALHSLQEKVGYGYDEPDIDEGVIKGSVRPGWGGQPFLSLNKDDYEDEVVGTNYDELVSAIEGSTKEKGGPSESEIAEDILDLIEKKPPKKRKRSAKLTRTESTLVQLTQLIEPHKTRIPGSDKHARALLRRIKRKKLSFRRAFNRKSGLFVPAWAKKGGSKWGGQQAARALVRKPKPSDTATFEQVIDPEILETFEDLSQSSQEESSSDSSSDESSSDSDSSSGSVKQAKKKAKPNPPPKAPPKKPPPKKVQAKKKKKKGVHV